MQEQNQESQGRVQTSERQTGRLEKFS